jgi:hypothetical protein
MLNKQVEPTQKSSRAIRLSETPGLGEIDHFLAQVLEGSGKPVEVC